MSLNQSFWQGLATVGLEVVGLLVAVALVGSLFSTGRLGSHKLRAAAAIVLGVAVVSLGFKDLAPTGALLVRAQRSSLTDRQGLDYCFDEDGAQARIPFASWLRQRMPAHAVYAVVLAGEPDVWCLSLALLPRLPAYGAARPQWLVAFGTIPPELSARIARHDPSVQVYAPGFALARETS